MKLASSVATLAVCIFLSACAANDKAGEIQQAGANGQTLSEAEKKVDDPLKNAKARREERRKRGDTLAIPYQDLQKYLPEQISGYTAQALDGQSTNGKGMSWAAAIRKYTNDKGEAIEITITDHNLHPVRNLCVEAEYSQQSGFGPIETPQTITGSFDPGIEYVSGAWQEYRKGDKQARACFIVADRFLIEITVPNTPNTKFAKDIGNSMSLKELAAK